MKSAYDTEDRDSDIKELLIGDWCVVTVMTGGPWHEKCYIVVDQHSGKAVIIDPGGRGDLITEEIKRLDVLICDVLLTHGHHDHVGSVASLCHQFNLKCLINQQDARLLRQAPLYAFRFSGRKIEMPAPVDFLGTKEYQLGTHTIFIHRTPGHTKGSVVFEFPGFAITGDTLLYQRVGRTDLPGGDSRLLQESIDNLLKELKPDTVLFPGHGRAWTVAEAQEWWSEMRDSAPTLDNFEILP
jgi:glyoxylase-like metal-dependent hydrolase (beta-lactamase superfamily II)